jgi:hypothetical protein
MWKGLFMSAFIKDVSISSYISKRSDLPRYHVRPRSELIMMTAYHLAREHDDHLNIVYIAWAMLRVDGSIAKDLLKAVGLTEEKMQAACAVPSMHQLDLDRFFERLIETVKARKADLIGTEHVLVAALTDDLLRARLTVWGVDVRALQQQANTITR